MQWELLTEPQFRQAVSDTGVCVLSIGVLERHGDHLPLGTDYINVHEVSRRACEIEPAVAFPPFYFGQINEARCFGGTVSLDPTLLFSLLENVLDEIGRNGFGKIVIANGHGGNTALLSYLAQCTLARKKTYTVYLRPLGAMIGERQTRLGEIVDRSRCGHAGEMEASLVLANAPEGADMDAVGDAPAKPLGRMKDVPGAFCGISWYANYPEHYAGDARGASKAKGQALVPLLANDLAAFIAAVKADTVAPTLESEFFERERGLRES